jgi:CDP-diacylglycerol--glycerol-3-phosphate 3-phosphatidyltransferase
MTAMNLPNRLTLGRIALIPIFVVFIRIDTLWAYALSLAVFVAAVITDYYDGKIARSRGSVTDFGTLFDPIADKVLIAAAFISFLDKDYLGIPSWVVIIIVGRELLVTGFRSVAARNGVVIPADKWGKLKTVSQMTCAITILTLMSGREAIAAFVDAGGTRFLSWYDLGVRIAALVLIMLALVFTVVSALSIFRSYRRVFVMSGAE